MATNYPAGRDVFGEPSAPDQTPLSSSGSATRNHVEHHRDLGDAVEALQEHSATTTHDHSGGQDEHGNITSKLKQVNTHEESDTDSSAKAIHHTLGRGATQAAAGNHKHDFNSSDITNKPFQICTSTTRPSNPVHGMQIFETDTHHTRTWTDIPVGSSRRWVLMPGAVIPICRLIQTVGQRILSGGSTLEWNLVDEESQPMYFPNSNRTEVVIPESGLYEVSGAVAWDPDVLFGDNAYTEILINGQRSQYTQSEYVRGHLFNPGFPQTVMAGGRIRLNAGDRVSVRARHNGAFAQITNGLKNPGEYQIPGIIGSIVSGILNIPWGSNASVDGIPSRLDVVYINP